MKLGVLFLHGMGESRSRFSAECEDALRDYLQKDGHDVSHGVVFGEALWADEMNEREAELMAKVAPRVDKERIRGGLIVGGFGDVTQYVAARGDRGCPSERGHAYQAAMGAVDRALRLIDLKALTREERIQGKHAPVVVLSHSLGCLVASDFIKGDQHRRVRSWVTFGCNLPLFYLAGCGMEVPPPLKTLRDGSKPWINVYDPDDVFGFPMAVLDDKHEALCRDFSINTGGIARSHTNYWDDRDFVALAGDHIRRARKALL